MIDFFGLPDNQEYKEVFYTNGSTNAWQVWNKPANCRFVSFYLLGGGGGGGGGRSSNTNTGPGGGGGGSSAITSAFFQACLLPDTLYIQVGNGGLGGTVAAGSNGTAGGSGNLSYVSIAPNTTLANVLIASGAAAAGGGGGSASTSVGGSAGIASTVYSFTTNPFANLGLVTTDAGQAGGAGSGIGNGTSITIALTVSGGAGGGYVSSSVSRNNGGSINASGIIPLVSGSLGAAIASQADSGFSVAMPTQSSYNSGILAFTGGGGGGAGHTQGGNGGAGAYGSGGGGGGGCYIGLGGVGGRGGDGIVIITCW